MAQFDSVVVDTSARTLTTVKRSLLSKHTTTYNFDDLASVGMLIKKGQPDGIVLVKKSGEPIRISYVRGRGLASQRQDLALLADLCSLEIEDFDAFALWKDIFKGMIDQNRQKP